MAVACGVLQDPAGRVLITQRPAGKIAAGKWEFPGGKIEPGESAHAALARELGEELGIAPTAARPLIRFTHAYSDRIVTLDTWLVTGWTGEVQGRERQRFQWHAPDGAIALDLLPTVQPILRALRLPVDYVFTPPEADEELIFEGLARLPRGALLRLRLPARPRPSYEQLARRLVAQAPPHGLRIVLDRDAKMARDLGADGWHASQHTLLHATADEIELAKPLLRIASCHDVESLARARSLEFDAAVLGHVAATGSHPGAAPLGWPRFAALAGAANLPVYAIGGLGPTDRATAFAHHAQGVAGISAYWSRSGS
ncbi:MAG: Nudix family hydrolase [Panacagrimonas sp.]